MSFETEFVAAGNDYDAALERATGDAELLQSLMAMFLADNCFSELKAALENNDCKAAFAAAHSLKGSSGMLGMTALFDALSRITEFLRAGALEPAKAMFPIAKREYERIVSILGAAL